MLDFKNFLYIQMLPNPTFGFHSQIAKHIQKSKVDRTYMSTIISHLMLGSFYPTKHFSFNSPTCKLSKSSNVCMVCMHPQESKPSYHFIHPHSTHILSIFKNILTIHFQTLTKSFYGNKSSDYRVSSQATNKP